MFKKLIIHGIILAVINFFSIICGYAFNLYFLTPFKFTVTVQIIIAFGLTQMLFVFWDVIVSPHYKWSNVELNLKNMIIVLAISLILILAVFIPAHFLRRGYMTSFANIYYTWLFQIPTNMIAMYFSRLFIREKYHPKLKN